MTSVTIPAAEANFKAVARHIPVLCWLCRYDRTRAYFSDAWKTYTGRGFNDGQWRECIHPDDRGAFEHINCGCEIASVQYREVRIASKTGEYRWHRVTCTPAADEGEMPEAHIFVAFDIQYERDALAEAEKTRQRLALATEAAKVGVFEIDPAKGTVIWNERVARTYGIPLDAFDGRLDTMRGFLIEEDRIEVTARVNEMIQDGYPTASLQYRIRRPDGEIRHIRSFLLASVGDDGATTLHGALVDWTSNVNDHEHMKLLLAELTHRVKNSMATVQSIAMQTAPTDDDFRETFCARIHTLSAVHDLNIKGDYFGASVQDILEAVLRQRLDAPSTRWSFTGPAVLINPAAAVNFGLIVHELAYNAVSYGSLSEPGGCLDITWEIEGQGEEQILRIIWRETGGPPVEPPEYRGFGTRFVTTFSRHMRGRYEPDYRPDGVVVVLEIPTMTILANINAGLMKP